MITGWSKVRRTDVYCHSHLAIGVEPATCQKNVVMTSKCSKGGNRNLTETLVVLVRMDQEKMAWKKDRKYSIFMFSTSTHLSHSTYA